MEDPVAEEGEEEDPQKYAPKFQKHIYPDSVILIRGDDDELRARAAKLSKEDNLKWDRETLERRLREYSQNNCISLFQKANNDPNMGHPTKALKPVYPMTRFFQENKTEIFELDCNGNAFEMFESMRVYIERNGRSNNYLPPVKELNVEREKHLVDEEKETKADKAAKIAEEKRVADGIAADLESLQDARIAQIRAHVEDIKATEKLNMRQFLMKQVIPVLTEGMIDVYKVGPTDPVDYLSDYIFRKSNELGKR